MKYEKRLNFHNLLQGNAGGDGGGSGGGAFGNLAMAKLKSGQGKKESIVSADSVSDDQASQG